MAGSVSCCVEQLEARKRCLHFNSHPWPEPLEQEACPRPSYNRVAEKSLMWSTGARTFEMRLNAVVMHGLSGTGQLTMDSWSPLVKDSYHTPVSKVFL